MAQGFFSLSLLYCLNVYNERVLLLCLKNKTKVLFKSKLGIM